MVLHLWNRVLLLFFCSSFVLLCVCVCVPCVCGIIVNKTDRFAKNKNTLETKPQTKSIATRHRPSKSPKLCLWMAVVGEDGDSGTAIREDNNNNQANMQLKRRVM